LFAQKSAQRLSNTRFAVTSGGLKSPLANHLATTTQSFKDSTLGLALQPRGTYLYYLPPGLLKPSAATV
jgi:hypothetical protein